MVRAKKMANSLNQIAPIIKSGLMCDSAAKIIVGLEFMFTGLIIINLFIQFASLCYLNASEIYITNWNIDRFVVRLVSNIPFMFYLKFCTISALYIAFFGCFEKVVIKTLGFQPVHPLKDVHETNNRMVLFGCIKYNICNEEHDIGPLTVEKLRCLHELICVSIRKTNNALNPQLLLLLTMELAVLVIHWYSVIIYLKYNNISSLTNTINLFNWIFILTHSIGIFLFLRSGQQVMSLVSSELQSFLF